MSTPASNKTPFRRLGLSRTVRKTDSNAAASSSTPQLSQRIAESSSPATPVPMRPFKGTRSSDEEDDEVKESNVFAASPVTPASVASTSKRTRLSLSRSWKNRITLRKELNLKRRKLLPDVESCTELVRDACPPQPEPNQVAEDNQAPGSARRQQIDELTASILVWRQGCIDALNDLQERRGTEDMETLLAMFQIPHELVHFDSETQEFLDPD